MKFIIRILIFLLLSILINSQQNNAIRLNQMVNNTLKPAEKKIYTLTINQKYNQTSNLFFIAESINNDPFDVPALIITKGERVWVCSNRDQADFCYVNSSQIHLNDVFNIQLSCIVQCSFSFYTYINSVFLLNLGAIVTLEFKDQAFGILIQTRIPSYQLFDEIAITGTLTGNKLQGQGWQIVSNVGINPQIPTLTSYQYKGIPLWLDGLGIFLNANQDVKPGDKILTLIYGSKNLELLLRCYSVKNQLRQIRLNQEVIDDVKVNNSKIYFLNLTNILYYKSNLQIKIIKYSGLPEVTIYHSDKVPNDTEQVIDIANDESIEQYILTPQIRKKMNFTTEFYITIKGIMDSTFMIYVSTDVKNYVTLNDNVAWLSQLDGLEFNNYIYMKKVSLDSQNLTKIFELKIFLYTSGLTFGVRRCQALEQNIDTSCLLKKFEDVKRQENTFNTIPGNFHRYGNSVFFVFSYDFNDCQKNENNTYATCLFHIATFRNYSEGPITKYMIEFKQTSYQIPLTEGVSKKDRVDSNQYRNYRFTLTDITDVIQVRFYLTVISGKCKLVSSNTTKFPRITDSAIDPNVILATQDSIRYTDVSKQYYLSVKGTELAYYMLSVKVIRKNKQNTTYHNLIQLTQGMTETFNIHQDQQYMQFYINFQKGVQFQVKVISLTSLVWFRLYPAQNKTIINKQKYWASNKGLYILIDNIDSQESATNEFIVVVYSVGNASFSINFQTEKCLMYFLGKPLQILAQKNKQQCWRFSLTKISELQIVLSYEQLELSIDQLNMAVVINNTQTKIISKLFKFSSDDLLKYCPNLNSNNIHHACDLQVKFNSTTTLSFLLAVQYTDHELLLLDGSSQIVNAVISKSSPRHFYYQIHSNRTIVTFIRSKTNTNYKMIGKIIQQVDYSDSSQYPQYQSNKSVFISETSRTKITSLIIQDNDIQKLDCKNCLLLLAVFSDSKDQVFADFKIQISQDLQKLAFGQTKLDYIKKDQTKRYSFSTDGQNNMLLSVNKMVDSCTYILLYAHNQNSPKQDKLLTTTFQSEIVIEKTLQQTYYVLEIQGRQTCYFQLNLGKVQQSIREIYQGISFEISLDINEKNYFLFYNNKNETLRIFSMTTYGEVSLGAVGFKLDNVADINSWIEQNRTNYNFGGVKPGSIQLNKSDENFCVNCYYLIVATANIKTLTTLLVHGISTPVPALNKKIIENNLNESQSIEYLFYSFDKFILSIDVLYGQIELKIVNNEKEVVSPFRISKSLLIQIPAEKTNDTNLYTKQHEFQIFILVKQTARYTMILSIKSDSLRIKQSIPFMFNVKPEEELCVEFLSGVENPSAYLFFQMQNTTSFNYKITCLKSQCPNSLIIKQNKSIQNINVNLQLQVNLYNLCMNSSIKQQVNILITNQMVSYLKLNSKSLVSATQLPNYYSIYNPKKESIMVQIFECKGSVQIQASENYKDLIQHNPNILVEHTQIAGHYIATVQTPKSGIYFLQASILQSNANNDTLYIIKYSVYENNQNPYKKLFVPNGLGIEYLIHEDYLIFTVGRLIQQEQNIDIIGVFFTIYISNTADNLKSATQCQLGEVYNKTISFISKQIPHKIDFTVKFAEIDKILKQSEYFYISVVAYIEVIPLLSHNSDFYKIIYNSIKISGMVVDVGGKANKSIFVSILVWVIIPLLAFGTLFIIAARFCIKKLYYEDRQLIEEDDGSKSVDLKQINAVKLEDKSSQHKQKAEV